jgi:hypothetical protein
MEQATQQGTITATIAGGSVVNVGITGADGVQRWYAADGNMLRRAQASIGKLSLCGLRIEYEVTGWRGLKWFSIMESGYVVGPNCQRHMALHIDPDACFFGMHRRKTPPPTNGVHDDEA